MEQQTVERTTASNVAPLIVTLELDAQLGGIAQRLRDAHFPPAINLIPAHLTLFHHLPGEQVAAMTEMLAATCERTDRPAVRFATVRFLGKGVAIAAESGELLRLRAELAARWADVLTPQDRQKFQPHVTVQNKVAPEVARKLFADLRATWTPVDGHGVALRLWHYRGGPWEAAGRFAFRDGPR